MRELLIWIFGAAGMNVLIKDVDGKEWALVKDICNLMGIGCEYHAVDDRRTGPEYNLAEVEKLKIFVPDGRKGCPVWFVSESGFWKIVGRSNSAWAQSYRAKFFTDVLPSHFRQLTPNMEDHEEA